MKNKILAASEDSSVAALASVDRHSGVKHVSSKIYTSDSYTDSVHHSFLTPLPGFHDRPIVTFPISTLFHPMVTPSTTSSEPETKETLHTLVPVDLPHVPETPLVNLGPDDRQPVVDEHVKTELVPVDLPHVPDTPLVSLGPDDRQPVVDEHVKTELVPVDLPHVPDTPLVSLGPDDRQPVVDEHVKTELVPVDLPHVPDTPLVSLGPDDRQPVVDEHVKTELVPVDLPHVPDTPLVSLGPDDRQPVVDEHVKTELVPVDLPHVPDTPLVSLGPDDRQPVADENVKNILHVDAVIDLNDNHIDALLVANFGVTPVESIHVPAQASTFEVFSAIASVEPPADTHV